MAIPFLKNYKKFLLQHSKKITLIIFFSKRIFKSLAIGVNK